jgi:hypothetical protein
MTSSMAAAGERLEALIGRSGPTVNGFVERRDIERFARASGEDSPIYYGEEGVDDQVIPAPPILLSAMINWGVGPALDALRPDGTGVDRERWLPLDGLRLMGAGQELEVHRQVSAGQAFAAEPTLQSVTRKSGAGGGLILLVIKTVFRAEDGSSLLTCQETLIAR